MRLKIICVTDKPAFFPYNYNSTMQAMIYHFIQNSSQEFSEFLHKKGFIKDNKHFKLFTFSKLFFLDGRQSKSGFSDVTKIEFLFSTPIQKSYEHLVLGIFANQEYTYYYKKNDFFKILISHVESVPEPEFTNEMKFTCLSPISVSTRTGINGKLTQHYLDYMLPIEREQYIRNLGKNLLQKHSLIFGREYEGNMHFNFSFDTEYILKRKGTIRKNIRFKKEKGSFSHIIAMEAPFFIKTAPKLIKLGYDCGFGEKNSAGFGMVELIKGRQGNEAIG